MCELFAMSSSQPTDVNHSLALLRPRGGELGPHADGWGVACYEGCAARVFKEPVPAAQSRCLTFIADYDFQSAMVIAHIRRANSVVTAKAGRETPDGYYNVERMLKRVLAGNGNVLLCGTCMEARSLDDAALIGGARRSTMDELATATLQADKVMVF
jgi:hypothetical protein